MNSDEITIEYFKEVILFFKEFQWIYNLPVTKLLCNGSLNLFPTDWLESLKLLGNNELNNFVVNLKIQLTWPPSLIDFVNNCHKFNKLPSPVVSVFSSQLPQAFVKHLSIKKQHEIFHLANLVHEQCLLRNINLLVDLGAGLGYICQLLHYLYGYKVLGIEAKLQNVITAKARQKDFFSNSLSSIKYVCMNITTDSAQCIESILQKEFGSNENICLMGLHACGDLSVYMSKIYLEMNVAQIFILVSCCYHKLSLKNNGKRIEDHVEKEYFNYFPLSESLNNAIHLVNIDIGNLFRRPFMRLACQETSDRWSEMLQETHDKHSFYVLARAVLELYGIENELYLKKLKQKGTRKSQCSNFKSYLNDSMNRYIYEKKIKDKKSQLINWNTVIKNDIINLWKKHKEKQDSVELYTALQLILQHAAESLILYDRSQFLKENNCNVKIIPIVNRSLSPRCYATVAIK